MKVAVITGSRADWNGLGMVALALRARDVEVNVIAIGQHADCEEGLRTVIADGFDPFLARTNFRDEMAIGCGAAALAVQGALNTDRPEMVILLGDRFEILGAASAAALLDIPIAHIGGGDVTEGSIDNSLRYAITALSTWHFVTNETSERRLYAHRPRVQKTGNPALDRIGASEYVSRETLFRELDLLPSTKNILVAFHAATKEQQPWVACQSMLNALNAFDDVSFLVLGTNADTGSEAINSLLAQFCDDCWPGAKRQWKGNLSPAIFYSALQHFDCMVGNSSAGLVETPTFGIPVVNIGHRQTGRAQARNVHSCASDTRSIVEAVSRALHDKKTPCPNPYGDGKSAARIADTIIKALSEQ